MARYGDTVWMLCNEFLHPFEVAVAAVDIQCPFCGCKYARIDPAGGEMAAKMIIDVKEPYALPVDSWVQRLPEREHTKTIEESDAVPTT